MHSKHQIVIGVSSGIAGYKVVDLIELLKQKEIVVIVIMTKSAVAMFGSAPFEKASGRKVYVDLFEQNFTYKKVLAERKVDHIDVSSKADLFVIAPATANTIAKMAYGLADDFLTTSLLATTAPVLVCPSMNTNMWNHPATVANRERLRGMGYIVLSPDIGDLACGTWGAGRLPPVEVIADAIDLLLKRTQALSGKRVLVTAGGTQEAIDAVRVITNRSTGKMGAAIADACWQRGAVVTLLCSKTALSHIRHSWRILPQGTPVTTMQYLSTPWRKKTEDTSEVARRDSSDGGGNKEENRLIKVEVFETSAELEQLMISHVKSCDIVIHCAAVSDFVPSQSLDRKIDSNKPLKIILKPAKKLLHHIKKWNPKVLLIGFKAVYQLTEKQLIEEGKKKVLASGADYIIVNDVGRPGIGFGVDDNEVYIVGAKGLVNKIDKSPKRIIAAKILDWIFGEAI